MIEVAAAMAVLTPYLIEAGHSAAKTAGKEAAETGGKLLGWLREKMAPRGKEALAELEQKPDLASNQDDVRVQLTKLLEQNPGLVAELRALLPATGSGGDRMKQHVEGAGAKGVQIHGISNVVKM
jgi:hypothetical protein